MSDLATLVPGWGLTRDFAVRSAGFPVAGLEAFGAGDEPGRLRDVARDPRFQEAVTWQNPAALVNAVLNLADGAVTKPSRARQREEVVASYWQRYCAKNDTIGFFGPLAWGRIRDDGPPLHARSGALVRERSVHLEAWGVQALAETLDPELKVAGGPHTERELRTMLETHRDRRVRDRGLAALDRLEAARDALTAAPPAGLRDALAALDATFVELTGREPVRHHGRAYGARTLAYVDCMRDLEVAIGPGLVTDLAPALQTLFEAGRWYCGRINAIGRAVVERALVADARGPFPPLLGTVLGTLMRPAPEVAEEIAAVVAELHGRLATVVADPDAATVGRRAAAAFGDHLGTWRHGVFSSVDVQIAAADEGAVADGEYLAVIGDVHPGGNPLIQGVFAHRHPEPAALLRVFDDHVGLANPMLLPPFAPGMGVDGRGIPLTPAGTINIAVMPDARAQAPRRTWLPDELLVDGDEVVDRSGQLRMSVYDVFAMPVFISGVRAFELLPDVDHSPRVTLGRTVLRREGWSVPAAEVPRHAEDVARLARDRRMPRRLFTKSPLERKPMYLDVESPALCRILCRQARKAAESSPQARIGFTEMLPGPAQCWLADPDGRRYVSELRIVAVDEAASATSPSAGRGELQLGL
jgi:hypothetical protein